MHCLWAPCIDSTGLLQLTEVIISFLNSRICLTGRGTTGIRLEISKQPPKNMLSFLGQGLCYCDWIYSLPCETEISSRAAALWVLWGGGPHKHAGLEFNNCIQGEFEAVCWAFLICHSVRCGAASGRQHYLEPCSQRQAWPHVLGEGGTNKDLNSPMGKHFVEKFLIYCHPFREHKRC